MKYSDLLLENNKQQYKQMMQPLVDNDIVNDADAQQVITSARQILKRNDRITWYLKWYRVTAIKQKLGSFMGRGLSGDAELASQKEAIDKMYAKAVKGLQMPSTSSVDSQLHNFGRLFMDLTKQSTTNMMGMMEQIPALSDVKWDGSPSDLNDKLQAIETEWKKSSDQEIQVDQYETDAWEVLIDHNGKQGWVLLNMEYCKLEGGAMGHCGNAQAPKDGDRILSFRTITSEKHKPHLTFVLGKDGKLGEMKGRENDKPAAKYHGVIVALLKHDIVKGFGDGGGEPEKNFSMDDLSDDISAELIKEKPVLDPWIPVHNIEYYENGSIEREEYRANGGKHREDGPASISYNEDGSIESEEYYIKGKRHREDGPASIQNYEDGTVFAQYYINDETHREDGPAEIWYNGDGSKREGYHIDGQWHREDGPSFISYYPDGSIRAEEYYINSKHHREDGPAHISYSEDGAISRELYYTDDAAHREDGPAAIQYYSDGSISREEYRVNGKRHREEGPANISYNEDGSIRSEEYSINGKQHREDGPAEISYYGDGSIQFEVYRIKGKKYREDGPATIVYYRDGSIEEETYYDDERGDHVINRYSMGEYHRGSKFPDKKQNESINRLQQLAGIK